MSISEAYKKLCIENEKMLRDECKKRGLKFGDLVLCWDGDDESWGDDLWIVISWYTEDAMGVIRDDGACGPVLLNELLPLPSQRQLQEMLEERGHRNYTLGAWSSEKEKSRYLVQDFNHPDQKQFFGLDPETVLLRALVEAVKGG